MNNQIVSKRQMLAEQLSSIDASLNHRGISPELKEFVHGLKVFAEKTSIEFNGAEPTTLSRITSAENLKSYRQQEGGENFVVDFKELLKDKEAYIQLLQGTLGDHQAIERIRHFSTFLESEFSKNITQYPNAHDR